MRRQGVRRLSSCLLAILESGLAKTGGRESRRRTSSDCQGTFNQSIAKRGRLLGRRHLEGDNRRGIGLIQRNHIYLPSNSPPHVHHTASMVEPKSVR